MKKPSLRLSSAVPRSLAERLKAQRYVVEFVHRPADKAVITVVGSPKSGKTRLGQQLRKMLTGWGYDVVDYRDLNLPGKGPRLQLGVR